MSTSVSRALADLGKPVTYVGADGQVSKGTPDLQVAQSAKVQRRVVVTFNFDMVLAACELGVRFIWFDQRGRSPSKLETALIFLRQWERWETELSDPTAACLKVGREATEVLSIDQARTRAERRFRKAEQTKRRVARHVAKKRHPQLTFDDPDE